MKKLLFAAILCCGLQAKAQLTFEKSYSNAFMIQYFDIENIGLKYVVFDRDNHKLYIYNVDHSLMKTVNLIVPPGTTFSAAPLHLSTKLFNDDDKIEFLYTCADFSINTPTSTTYVMNEDGSVLQTISGIKSYAMQKAGSQYKLVAYTWDDKMSIYSLYGSLPSTNLKPNGEKTAEADLYPNPMETAATLRYTLPSGTQQATINIYTSDGKLTRQMQVTDQFGALLIQRGDLPAGNYYYQVTAPGVQTVSEQFVIR